MYKLYIADQQLRKIDSEGSLCQATDESCNVYRNTKL